MKKTACLFLILILLCVSAGCDTPTDLPREKILFEYFDTISTIYCYSEDSQELFGERCSDVESILLQYHKLFDIYNEYEGINNLCTLNKNAGGAPVKVDEKLIDFLIYAKEIYEKTNGETNVMMGAVLRLWHDARTEASRDGGESSLPEKSELALAAEHISIDLLEIDAETNSVRISDPQASIDVGAIGKGYASERAAEQLLQSGADGYVIDVGGNLRMIGSKPDGTGWKTGIRDPENTQRYAHILTLSNTSCVTSGDYERYYIFEGKKYHHIIDKDTLMPSEHFSSVTVITEDSATADALSTALFCMSYEDGRELLEHFDGAYVIWITKSGEKILSE